MISARETREAEDAARQKADRRLSDDSEMVLFHDTLSVLRQSFELRKPDAWDNAWLLRDKYALVAEAAAARCLKSSAAMVHARATARRVTAIEDVMTDYINANLLVPRGRMGPTPETIMRPGRDNALLSLVRAGHLDHSEESAANQISQILEAVTASQHARVRNGMQGGGGGGRGSDFLPSFLADWHSFRYLPWCGAMLSQVAPNFLESPPRRKRQHLDLVLAVVRDGISLDTARRNMSMGWPTALRLLKNGLQLYNAICDKQESGSDLPRLERYRRVLAIRDGAPFRYREVIQADTR